MQMRLQVGARNRVCAAFAAMAVATLGGLSGCSKSVDKVADSVTKVGDDVVKASENFNKAAASLDPLALKKLMDENATLRDGLESLSRKYQSAMGSGALVVSAQSTFLRVTDYSGALRVSASIDSGGQTLLLAESELPSRARSLGFNADNYLFKQQTKEIMGPATVFSFAVGTITEVYRPDIAQRLQAHVDSLFAGTQKALPVSVSAWPAEIWLNPRFPGSGLHKLIVSAKPRSLDADKWHLVWELVSRDPDGKNEKVLASYNMNQMVCPKPADGSDCSRDALLAVTVAGNK